MPKFYQVPLHPVKEKAPPTCGPYSTEELQAIVEAHPSVAAAAVACGVNKGTMYYWLDRAGIPRKKNGCPYSDAQLQAQIHAAGSVAAFARKEGIGKNTAWSWVKQAGVTVSRPVSPVRPKRPGRVPKPCPYTDEELQAMYDRHGTIRGAVSAEKMDISEFTLARWMKPAGVQIRRGNRGGSRNRGPRRHLPVEAPTEKPVEPDTPVVISFPGRLRWLGATVLVSALKEALAGDPSALSWICGEWSQDQLRLWAEAAGRDPEAMMEFGRRLRQRGRGAAQARRLVAEDDARAEAAVTGDA